MLDEVFGTGPAIKKLRLRSQLHCNAYMTPGSFIATPDAKIHRRLRAPLNPFFSKQSIQRLEPFLQRCLLKAEMILRQHASSSVPITLNSLFNAMTNDIITEYSFGKCWDNLEQSDLNAQFFAVMSENTKMWHFSSYYPWIMANFESIPPSIIMWMLPAMKVLIPHFQVGIRSSYFDIFSNINCSHWKTRSMQLEIPRIKKLIRCLSSVVFSTAI
jgi:hypothetical protein